MKTFYFLIKLLSLSLILSNTYGQKHTCSHDSKKSYNIPSDYNETFESKYGKRNLQSSRNIKPFRVTFDSSQLKNKTNGEGMTNDKSKYIIQIMKTAQIFLGNFIQVVPRNQPITSSYGWTSCGQQQYPPSLYKNGIGIPNSDMHILVSYQNDTTSSNVAFANLCELDPGPTITNIVFNIASMDMNFYQKNFQQAIQIQQGYCMCLDGYVGEDCSLSCAYPNILEENKCVAICSGLNYKNPDNTCKPKCPQGYYKDQPTKTCILCHSNCSNCTGPLSTQCSSCNLGYLQKGNTCDSFPCDPTCGTCFGLGSNQCTSCQPGYILSGSTCLPIECHPSCKSCSSPNNANSCTDCFAESYLNAYKQCVYCTLPCKDCKSENQCTSCINDEYIIDSVKQVCKLKCHNTCTLCFQANDNTKCDSCIDGYYIDRTTCKICNSPCSKCTQSPTKCIECAANYQINNQNECIPQCDQSCNTCSKPLDKNSCITCNKGYTMVNSLCQQCTYPCTECQTSQTNCTKCAPSHVLRDNVCEPICDDSCLTCFKSIDPNSCTSCNPGFYLSVNNKEVQGSCKQCQSFCQTCKDGQTCQECIQGYLLQKDGSCSPICDTSCLTCSKPNDRNSCLSCSAPLVLQDRSCKQCQSFCQTCKDGQTCQECIQGYLLQKDGSCSPICDASCLTCSKPNDKNSCLSCSAPLVLQNSQCQQCDDGFYFDNGSCSKCSNNCKSCSNKLKCGICMDGYILDSTFNCIKSNTCHFTCQNCIGDLYYQCTFCPHNRLLVKIDESLSYGICQCPEDTTDSNEPECEQSKVQQYLKQTIIGSFAGSAFKSILISAGLFNPLLALSYFQLSQGISYLNLINARQSVGFDEVLRVISSSNFDFKQFKSPSKSNNNKRILPDQSSNIDLINDYQININPKIALNNKNYNFLENSQTNLWIQAVFRPLQQFKHNVILLLINFIITLLSIIYATSLSPQNDTKQSKTLSLVMLSIIITTYVVLITFWVLILLYIIYNQLRKCTSKDLVTSDQPKKLPQSQIPQLKDEQASQLNVNDNTQIQFGPKSGQFSQNQLQSDKRINVLYSARVL
ncbi:hypothetical protein ABPG73_017056 [Tetrahymena malaccensis]